MMTRLRRGLVAFGALGVAIQLVPVSREDPAVIDHVAAPDAVEAVLRRACFDCHSRTPRRPFYAYVAPVSWLVAYDIARGREHLDFDDWGRAADEREEIAEVVDGGEMPPWFYAMMSSERRLSPSDRALLVQWAGGGSTERRHDVDDGAHEEED